MNKNKHIRVWFNIGTGRGTALSIALKCSRQYVNKISKLGAGISDSAWNSIYYAMQIVELDEMRSINKIEQNILKSAHLSHSKDNEIKMLAQAELDKWIELLGAVK